MAAPQPDAVGAICRSPRMSQDACTLHGHEGPPAGGFAGGRTPFEVIEMSKNGHEMDSCSWEGRVVGLFYLATGSNWAGFK